MALAASLLPNFQYEVIAGFDQGDIVTIVNNIPFKDGDPEGRQRKITVRRADGTEDYMLPRVLGNEPVGLDVQAVDNFVAQQMGTPVPVPAADVLAKSPTSMAVRLDSAPLNDPMDPRLDHLRPSRSVLRQYIKREMSNGMTDIEFLLTFTTDKYRVKNEGYPANIMMKGDTQAGKTMLVECLAIAWADLLKLPKPMPIFTLSGSQGISDFDLFGQTTDYQGNLVWLPGIVALAAQCGGILYVDEINAIVERTAISLNPLVDYRHSFTNRNKAVEVKGQIMPEVVKAHPDLWVVGTYNEGYRGMGDMNESFINRFRHIPWGYDEKVERKLVPSGAVRLLGECIRKARATNQHGLRTPVGTKALQRLSEDIESLGIEIGLEVFIGMFKGSEQAAVKEIIDGRSIRLSLEQEAMAAAEQDAEEEQPF
jgi:hypothetical protein